MVTLDHRTLEQTRNWADRRLSLLLAEWRELPLMLDEIDSWDDGEAMTYVEEWRFHESQRALLEQAAERDLLTQEQLEQLGDLRELVAEHHSKLQRLLGR